MSQIPSVGRMVHYVSHGSPVRPDGTQAYTSQCRAAIVTEATWRDDEKVRQTEDCYDVSLMVVNPEGVFFKAGIEYDEWDSTQAFEGSQPRGGSWHWPERV